MKRKCAVTGSNGFLGARIAQHLESLDWEVVRLQRSQTNTPFILGTPPATEALAGVEAVVHTAYDFKAYGWGEVKRVNVDGSIQLFEAARKAGVNKFIYISSISAFEGCTSWYGRGKLAVEKYVSSIGGVNLRPGLVYGVEGKGMFGSLSKLVRLPLLPVFGGGTQPMYLVHVDDVAQAVSGLIEKYPQASSKVLTVADSKPLLFRDLLRELARRDGRGLRSFSLPAWIGIQGLRTLERLGLRLGFRSDSLLGLLNYNPNPDFSPTQALGVRTRSFN